VQLVGEADEWLRRLGLQASDLLNTVPSVVWIAFSQIMDFSSKVLLMQLPRQPQYAISQSFVPHRLIIHKCVLPTVDEFTELVCDPRFVSCVTFNSEEQQMLVDETCETFCIACASSDLPFESWLRTFIVMSLARSSFPLKAAHINTVLWLELPMFGRMTGHSYQSKCEDGSELAINWFLSTAHTIWALISDCLATA